MANRDRVKIETLKNVEILCKIHPMPLDLSKMLKDNCLEKPTQNFFNHLAHYLVKIIDPKVALLWPLYDTKAERTYRNQMSVFIAEYSSKGMLAPVMSSYLVNPGCYKVIFLMFELSLLAVHRVLLQKMAKHHQTKLSFELIEKNKSQLKSNEFTESTDKEAYAVLSKVSRYLQKRTVIEECAKLFRDRIIQMENKIAADNVQGLIDNIVDGYVKKYAIDGEAKTEIEEIKNVHIQPKFFDNWLSEVDKEIDNIESQWNIKTSQFFKMGQKAMENTKALISRQTGEADTATFTLEYNPKTDYFSTDDLENQVNSQQKYILKNIIKNDKLNFPNLIRGFLISICFILKNQEICNQYQFNEYLAGGCKQYSDMLSAMRTLMERVMKAEERLQRPRETFSDSILAVDVPEIPPLPDLTNLKMNKEYHRQVFFDQYTPLNLNKFQFNLGKQKMGTSIKSMPRSLLMTPFHVPREDSFRPMIAYNDVNLSSNHNLSIISQGTNRGNETIAEYRPGFTKEQICRLLSTKKSSSIKKFKPKMERPNIKIIKGGLFNESNLSDESIVMFRSHSSPNLCENKEIQSRGNLRSRKLSIMKEDPSLSEVSGISKLEEDSSLSSPHETIALKSTRKPLEASSFSSVSTNVTPRSDPIILEENLNKEMEFKQFKIPQKMFPPKKSREMDKKRDLSPRENGEVIRDVVLPLRKRVEKKEDIVLPPQESKNLNEELILQQQNNREIIKEPILSQSKIIREISEDSVLLQKESTELKSATPKTNPQIIKKTSSLEKIINRFKKVRASILPPKTPESNECKTIFEEKDHLNINDAFTANRNLLPDLLSPSCSGPNANDILDHVIDSDDEIPRKPRESLGTMLGVDHTFLDQFELVD